MVETRTHFDLFPVCKWQLVGLRNKSAFTQIKGDVNYHRGERREICTWRLTLE